MRKRRLRRQQNAAKKTPATPAIPAVAKPQQPQSEPKPAKRGRLQSYLDRRALEHEARIQRLLEKRQEREEARARREAERIASHSPSPLSLREVRFVEHYVTTENGTLSAKKAGYPERSAHQTAYMLLRKPEISAAIRDRRTRLANRYHVTADRVVAEVARLAFARMDDFMVIGADGEPILDLSGATSDQLAALQELTVEEFTDGRSDQREVRRVKFKLAPKKDALELLMKRLGLLTEKHQHSHVHATLQQLLDELDQEARGKPPIDAEFTEVPAELPGPNEAMGDDTP